MFDHLSPELIKQLLPILEQAVFWAFGGIASLTLTIVGFSFALSRYLVKAFFQKFMERLEQQDQALLRLDQNCDVCREVLPRRYADRETTERRLEDHDIRIRKNTEDCRVLQVQIRTGGGS